MEYRSDIDGLRAIAVLGVLLFHSGVELFSGGYVGVDIFFVISGYLITSMICKEVTKGEFTFISFYKRRIARILPALIITLVGVYIFGFVFYSSKVFDNLGKEIFFSSIGAANILFAQGVNYFVKDEAYQPLIHLWSLGVEEQFYLFWPFLLFFILHKKQKFAIPIVFILFFISFALSALAVEKGNSKAYFLLHYRAYELLFGVLISLFGHSVSKLGNRNKYNEYLSFFGIILIIFSISVFDKNTSFPGFNALIPCIGAALLIMFPSDGVLGRILSQKLLVSIGLISYPLYLIHQPLISFIYFFEIKIEPAIIFIIVLLLAGSLSWFIYKYIEKPLRKIARENNQSKSTLVVSVLALTLPALAFVGVITSKSNGLEIRFKYLNPYAMEVSNAQKTTFHEFFKRGYSVSDTAHSKALFIGDSVLQQYVYPLKQSLNMEINQIDTITRGGCVLLKNVDFEDVFSDISCDSLRESLYDNKKTYDVIFISQAWSSYNESIKNFREINEDYSKWTPFIIDTIKHLKNQTEKIVIIGDHIQVGGTKKLQPSIKTNFAQYESELYNLEVTNISEMIKNNLYFQDIAKEFGIVYINPYDIFCKSDCTLHDENWSYFSDSQHISSAATEFVVKKIKNNDMINF